MAAAPVALLEFFRVVVFNYLIANGDAHLKNFSLMETAQGDYMLAPAYDLLCTALHIDNTGLALHNGLYQGDHDEKSRLNYGLYTGASFIAFAEKAGIKTHLAAKIVDEIRKGTLAAMNLVDRSFLSKKSKEKYQTILGERRRYLGFK